MGERSTLRPRMRLLVYPTDAAAIIAFENPHPKPYSSALSDRILLVWGTFLQVIEAHKHPKRLRLGCQMGAQSQPRLSLLQLWLTMPKSHKIRGGIHPTISVHGTEAAVSSTSQGYALGRTCETHQSGRFDRSVDDRPSFSTSAKHGEKRWWLSAGACWWRCDKVQPRGSWTRTLEVSHCPCAIPLGSSLEDCRFASNIESGQ